MHGSEEFWLLPAVIFPDSQAPSICHPDSQATKTLNSWTTEDVWVCDIHIQSPSQQQALPGGRWNRDMPCHGGRKTCYGPFEPSIPLGWTLEQSQGPAGQDFCLGEATNGNGKWNEIQFALILRDKVHTSSMTIGYPCPGPCRAKQSFYTQILHPCFPPIGASQHITYHIPGLAPNFSFHYLVCPSHFLHLTNSYPSSIHSVQSQFISDNFCNLSFQPLGSHSLHFATTALHMSHCYSTHHIPLRKCVFLPGSLSGPESWVTPRSQHANRNEVEKCSWMLKGVCVCLCVCVCVNRSVVSNSLWPHGL